jgi:hypothetical protein
VAEGNEVMQVDTVEPVCDHRYPDNPQLQCDSTKEGQGGWITIRSAFAVIDYRKQP